MMRPAHKRNLRRIGRAPSWIHPRPSSRVPGALGTARRRLLGALLTAMLLALPGTAVAGHSVGVAPFELGGTGNPPDLATLLADRLTTAGVECAGPDRIGVPAVADPEPAQVQSWSQGSGVDAIVFGRVTGIGSRFSVDVQLRSAATGEVVSVYVAEIGRPGGVDAAVAELTHKVLEGLTALDGAAAPPAATVRPVSSDAAPAPAVAARPPARKRKSDGFFGGGGAPLRITSDDLEARQSGGARHMIFTRNVRATREDMTLTADRLDAFYPKGSSRPNKIVATGQVVMNREDGEAHCKKMTYLKSDGRIHCEGNAELVRKGDRAKGDKIEWDLETDTIFVKGNADILLIDEGGQSGS